MPETPRLEPERPGEQEISLDELTEAFAQVMGGEGQSVTGVSGSRDGEAADADAAPDDWPDDDERSGLASDDAADDAVDEDDACEISPRSILEGMLFVGNRDARPLSAQQAAELMRGVEPDEIPGLVEELNGRYDSSGCPYRVAGDRSGYRLALRKEFHPLRNRFYGRVREARLSQAAIDVLAIVAYEQPLTSEQVSCLRGRPSGPVLAQLVRRGLLRITREQGKGQAGLYSTTDRFLEVFGLKDLGDLPQSEDLEGQ